jgi:hypothetical protein
MCSTAAFSLLFDVFECANRSPIETNKIEKYIDSKIPLPAVGGPQLLITGSDVLNAISTYSTYSYKYYNVYSKRKTKKVITYLWGFQ